MAWASVLMQPCAADPLDLTIPSVRADLVSRLAEQSRIEKDAAEDWARSHGVAVGFEVEGVRFELMYLDERRPIYYRTFNVNAAITTATNRVRNLAPYDLNGEGLVLGLWDAGVPRMTHQEFQNLPKRITCKDVTQADTGIYVTEEHTTHLAGTIGAWGKDPNAMGMAPSVKIDARNWNADLSEMAACAASYPGEPNKYNVSNHSYGPVLGWERAQFTTGELVWVWLPLWLGTGQANVETRFGRYVAEAVKYDELAFLAPYYQIFVAAGNDRSDNPKPGEMILYSRDGVWYTADWYRDSHPRGDGVVKGGYDTIHPAGVAKNAISVGAVSDAVRDGARDLAPGGSSFLHFCILL